MSWMEPLAGLTRHPLICEDSKWLMSAAGFIPYSAENPMVKKVPSFFFFALQNEDYIDNR